MQVEAAADAEQEFAAYRATELETDILAYRQLDDGVGLQLRANPFYAESGGQISDSGHVYGDGWTMSVREVRRVGGRVAVVGRGGGSVRPGHGARRRGGTGPRRHASETTPRPTFCTRRSGECSATHVQQQGSLVAPDRLRFDFLHTGPMTREELSEVERLVNEAIWANEEVCTHQLPYREAIERGAMALFSEKYGDVVRVVEVPGVSMELCGGTHVRTTGEIGELRIVSESGVAAGVRRIEAVTGPEAYRRALADRETLRELAALLKTREENVIPRAQQLVEEGRELGRQLEKARSQSGGDVTARLLEQAVSVDGVKVIATEVELSDADEARALGDRLRERMGSGLAVYASRIGDRTSIFAVATDDLIQRGVRADAVIREVAAVAGGRGGGRPHMAQAGVGEPDRVSAALERVVPVVRDLLAGSGG